MRSKTHICFPRHIVALWVGLALLGSSCWNAAEDTSAERSQSAGSWHVGPAGGVLRADDLTIVIPPGAVAQDTVLSLEVDASGQVSVDAPITLLTPAVVGFSLTRWAPELVDDNPRDTAELLEGQRAVGARAYFTTLRLSSFSLPDAATIAVPLGFDAEPWRIREASAPWEPDWTIVPPVDRADITPECLVSASDLVEDRHDRPYRLLRLGRQLEEATTLSFEAYAGLATARALMAETMPGYDLWLTGAWDSSGRIHHRNSLHYFGVAVDLGLARWTGRSWVKEKPADPRLMGRIPAIMRMSGFSWVYFENRRHVHASVSSPSLEACDPNAPVDRHGASDPFLTLDDESQDLCVDVSETPTLLDCYQPLP